VAGKTPATAVGSTPRIRTGTNEQSQRWKSGAHRGDVGGVAVSTAFTRGLLRRIYSTVTDGVTLLDRLTALSNEAIRGLDAGKVLQSTSGNGRSVEFQVNAQEGVTPTEIAETYSQLLDLYDAAVSAGYTTDATRYGYMMGRLKPIRSFRNDYSNLIR
jgi:hypothetical protein